MGQFTLGHAFRAVSLKRCVLRSLAAAALAVAVFAAGPRAEATPLYFALTGDYTANWKLDSNPTPTGVNNADGSVFFLGVPGVDPLYLIFISGTQGYATGGVRISTGTDLTTSVGALFDLAGDQIYTGLLSAPVFQPGVYNLNYDFLTNAGTLGTTTLTIATTPIPAALPLLLTALAGLGFTGWRRRHSAHDA